jgi:hypothetical protein
MLYVFNAIFFTYLGYGVTFFKFVFDFDSLCGKLSNGASTFLSPSTVPEILGQQKINATFTVNFSFLKRFRERYQTLATFFKAFEIFNNRFCN